MSGATGMYTASGNNPSTAARRGMTAIKGGEMRPITSNASAGFQRTNNLGSTAEKFNQMLAREERPMTPKARLAKYELEINALIDESAVLASEKKLTEALDKAKEAVTKQKYLDRFMEENSQEPSTNNTNLRFCAALNLATMFEKNELYQEAIKEYTNLTNALNHEGNLEGFIRLNMGNIYFKQGNFPMAIKMYKKAINDVPTELKIIMPYKIQKNLAHAYVQKNDYPQAIQAYEEIVDKCPDFESAFNLIVCYFIKGDKEKLKNHFCDIVAIESYGEGEEEKPADEENETVGYKEDPLAAELRKRKRKANKIVLDAAKLIAPHIEDTIIDGYNWTIDMLKNSKTNFQGTLSEIEIKKAVTLIKEKKIEEAISTLKAFEKKDKKMMAQASTNISFLYFLEGDIKSSEKYADIALNFDKFNANALVNKGNCLFVKDDFVGAKGYYLEAIGVTTDCVEALYNLTLVNKKLGSLKEALVALQKIQTILDKNPEVLYQYGEIYERMRDYKEAKKWYDILLTQCPNDAKIHARIGALYANEQDESQAFHHYSESYRLMPTNIETIAWLGIYYVKQQLYEKACSYFERASQVNPNEIKWKLMVASCYRRMEDYDRALKLYKAIYEEAPDNMECLRFLVQICQEQGLPYQEYNQEFMRLKRIQDSEQDGGFQFGQAEDNQAGYQPQGPYLGRQDSNPPPTGYGGAGPSNRVQAQQNQQPQNNGGDDDWGNLDLLPDD